MCMLPFGSKCWWCWNQEILTILPIFPPLNCSSSVKEQGKHNSVVSILFLCEQFKQKRALPLKKGKRGNWKLILIIDWKERSQAHLSICCCLNHLFMHTWCFLKTHVNIWIVHVLHAGVSVCVSTPYPPPPAVCVCLPPCRVRRTVENKLFAGDERLEDLETELRAAKQAAQEWEARYEEVCVPPPPSFPTCPGTRHFYQFIFCNCFVLS